MTLQQQLAALMEELGTDYLDICIATTTISSIYVKGKEVVLFGEAYDKTLGQAIAEIKESAK